MNKKLIIVLLCLNVQFLYSQTTVRVSGFVKDNSTGEVLIGATVLDSASMNGTVTDNNGYFSFQADVPASLSISFVGFLTKKICLNDTSGQIINVKLESNTQLQEVIVYAPLTKNMNIASLTTKELEQIPSLSGKVDIGKSLQSLPGISTQKEGSSLLLVRGGDPGQNMYLFDNVSVIHVNHLGGFMSAFNPDIIHAIDVYKGGFPARYGGKISSIIDITQKDGDISGRKGSLSVGLTDISVCVEGPTKIKNTSFIIAGRKTLIDPLMALASKLSDGNDFMVAYGFHDVNSKITWKPNYRSSFSVNLYYGDDYLNYWQNYKSTIVKNHRQSHTWGNIMIAGHWKSAINSRLYSTSSFSYSRYRLKEKQEFTLPSEGGDFYNTFLSSVQDYSFRSSVKYEMEKNWSAEFGVQSSLQHYLPAYSFNNRKTDNAQEYISLLESGLYATNKIKFLKYSQIEIGIRLAGYFTEQYNKQMLEPRLNLTIGVSPNQRLNVSYITVNQYSHLIFTTGNIMLNEVWVPAGKNIKPVSSKQFTAGWESSFGKGNFNASLNLFYKTMDNLITYKEGYSSFKGDKNWQSKLEQNGKGKAYGLEFFAKKSTGKLTGFMGYTLSKVTRKYPEINNGHEFLFDFDRPHAFTISLNYKFTKKLNFNISWVYQTGLPYTPAIGKHYVPSIEPDGAGQQYLIEALIYGERNSARMKDYHRLDIGLKYEFTTKNNRKAEWNFGVYNLYNRQNPYYYYYNTKNGPEIIKPEQGNEILPLKLYQVSFFPIIPSVSYKLYFDRNANKTNNKKQKFKKWLYHEK